MLCVTTNSIDGKVVRSYRGLVAAEVVFGANFFRDVAASITDVVGGRSMSYEKEFEGARRTAVDLVMKKAEALRADAILGMRFDYQVLGEKNGMMMVVVGSNKSNRGRIFGVTITPRKAGAMKFPVFRLDYGPYGTDPDGSIHVHYHVPPDMNTHHHLLGPIPWIGNIMP